MRWTEDSGRTYGEEPYGGAGYGYAYACEGGGTVTGTAPLSWDAARHQPWTYPQPTAWDAAYGAVPTVPAVPSQPQPTAWDAAYGAVPAVPSQLQPTEWDAAYGAVPAVPSPETDTQPLPFLPEPDTYLPERDIPADEPVRPVFVDSSGRRQRRVLRAARLLMIPAGGYVALLISILLGGPGISAPFVPQPGPAHPDTPRAATPDTPSGTGGPAGSAAPVAAPAHPRGTTRPAPGRTSAPTAPTAPAAPTAAPARTTSDPVTASKGRALGQSHKPVK
ncbi:hypothetical protein [Streptomyces puniciscabiei]|uniref:hypothetical protein n=1 Tax=Streptomyces puniciscabiei TaxID=164348 RepID=UPI0037B9FC2B